MEEDRKPTAESIAESLTGFDEIAIEQKFGAGPSELSGTKMLRAMAFTLHRRAGMDDKTAYRECMQASLKDIVSTFADDSEDDEGKGESESETTPTPTS